MSKAARTLTATAPDGTPVSVNVGPKRVVGAIRIMDVSGWGAEYLAAHGPWLVTVHKTLANAVTGSNGSPTWNGTTRHAVEIGTDDQPVGTWIPASK